MIVLKWSKQENSLMVHFDAGEKQTGLYMLSLFSKEVLQELQDRNVDLTTLRLTLKKNK